MLDHDAVFEHGDLRVARALVRRFGADFVAHHHHPLDGLAPGEELGLTQDRRPAAAGVTAVTTALPLGLQPGRSVDSLNFAVAGLGRFVAPTGLTRLALVDDRVRRIIRGSILAVLAGTRLPASPAAASARGAVTAPTVVITVVVVGVVGVVGVVRIVAGIAVVGVVAVLLAATSPTSTASTAPPSGGRLVGLLVVGIRRGIVAVVVLIVIVVVVVRVIRDPNRLRRHEQRLIVGRLGTILGGRLEHQPRLGFLHLGFGRRRLRLDLGRGSHFTGAGFGLIGLLSRR